MSERRAKTTKQKAVAYHEAGHAVAAFYLHMPVYKATIKPDSERGTDGHVRHYKLHTGVNTNEGHHLRTIQHRQAALGTAQWLAP